MLAFFLAHAFADDGHGSSLALSILMVVGMVVPLIVLGFVVRIFWKAKVREDEAKRKSEWQSVRSS